jgi:hypothetical protein
MNYKVLLRIIVVLEMGSLFKKQYKHLPSEVAVAQSKGIDFLFA